MSAHPAQVVSRYVTLLPLVGLWIALGVLLSWLAGAGRLGATRVSVTVAFLVLATGIIPALLRPARMTMLAGWIATLLACIVIAPLELSLLPGTLPSPALLNLPGGTLLRLVCSALLGPAFVQFSALLLAQQRPSFAQTAWNSAFGLLLAAAALGLPPPFTLIAAAALILWFATQTCQAILRLLRARTQQARLLLATILAAELPLLLRPALAAAGLPIPYEWLLVTQLVLPLGISYAVTRHNLFSIDSIIRRAFGYSLLSVVVLALYLGVSTAFTILLAGLLPAARGLAVLIGLFAAAAAFTPLHKRTQQLIDAALYPERIAFRNAQQAAHAKLALVVQRAEVEQLLQHQLPDQLGALHAQLTLGPAPATITKPAESGWSSTLQVAETIIGHYQLGPRRSGLPYDPDEQVQLAALIRQAALALAYAETLEQLRNLNHTLEARVTTQVQQMLIQQRALVIANERQRLARDLHDSVTQTLFSMNLGARAIRGLLPADASTARQALIEQEAAARQALSEMRELLSQLQAPISEPSEQTAYSDLTAELHRQCTEFRQRTELEVTLDAPATVVLQDTQTVGMAQIAHEALTNVLKHSGVRYAQISLICTATATTLSITDQGCGCVIGSISSERYGLRGMYERAATFGGVLEVVSSVGQGTTVRVIIQESGADEYSGVSIQESE